MCVKPLTHMAKSEAVGHEKNESSSASGDQGRSGPSGSLPPNKTSSKHEEWSDSPAGESLQTTGHEGIIIPVRRKMTENRKATDQNLDGRSMPPGQSEGNLRLCPNTGCPNRDPEFGISCACEDRSASEYHRNKWRPVCPNTDRVFPCEHNKLVTEYITWIERAHHWDAKGDVESANRCYTYATVAHTRAVISQQHHDQHAERHERNRLKTQNKANAEANKGPWEFTLTYSPQAHGWNREEAKDAMRTACERLIRYYREEIEEFHAVGELTASGQPHVHAWYKLTGGRRMTTKSFKRAYPIWDEKRKLGRGHEGGHHAPVKRTSDFAGYIEKDLDTSWLILNITNASEADVQEAHDQDEVEESSQDGTAHPPAEPHDGELRECS